MVMKVNYIFIMWEEVGEVTVAQIIKLVATKIIIYTEIVINSTKIKV